MGLPLPLRPGEAEGKEEVQIEKSGLQRPRGVRGGLGVVCITRPFGPAQENCVNFQAGAKANRGEANAPGTLPATFPTLTPTIT